jgi:hypothetical protein
MRIAVAQKLGYAKLLKDAAIAIERGQLLTPAAAAQQVERASTALQQADGLAGANYGFAPARPTSTEVAR